ncbi:IPT/TIG domain-containing protein [Anthocerotibacter panamensis]|uniref:IPT/TIG domain-containing protein n=1 Tax=Anthocerotibacter panamensis TaxID=2857077 RepID=UPI001C405ADE|nr:IPT/TIG domain-containing protein [Anthocerotibacter panamensis]
MSTSLTVTPSTTPPNTPTITSVSSFNAQVGQTVTLTGNNLGNATQVWFGGVPAAFTLNVSTNTVTAAVPPNAPTAPISVVTPSGTTQTAQNFVPVQVAAATGQAQFNLGIAAQQQDEQFINFLRQRSVEYDNRVAGPADLFDINYYLLLNRLRTVRSMLTGNLKGSNIAVASASFNDRAPRFYIALSGQKDLSTDQLGKLDIGPEEYAGLAKIAIRYFNGGMVPRINSKTGEFRLGENGSILIRESQYDSEQKILEQVRIELLADPALTGTVRILSEYKYCPGCLRSISKFEKDFPLRVNLKVYDAVGR